LLVVDAVVVDVVVAAVDVVVMMEPLY